MCVLLVLLIMILLLLQYIGLLRCIRLRLRYIGLLWHDELLLLGGILLLLRCVLLVGVLQLLGGRHHGPPSRLCRHRRLWCGLPSTMPGVLHGKLQCS